MRKAQVSVFMVLGLVIFFIVLITMMINQYTLDFGIDSKPIRNAMESCISQQTKSLFSQIDDFSRFDLDTLERYIENKFDGDGCMRLATIRGMTFLRIGQSSVHVSINAKDVSVMLNGHYKISNGKNQMTIEKFSTKAPLQVADAYTIIEDIISSEKASGLISNQIFSEIAYSMDESEVIFTIKNTVPGIYFDNIRIVLLDEPTFGDGKIILPLIITYKDKYGDFSFRKVFTIDNFEHACNALSTEHFVITTFKNSTLEPLSAKIIFDCGLYTCDLGLAGNDGQAIRKLPLACKQGLIWGYYGNYRASLPARVVTNLLLS